MDYKKAYIALLEGAEPTDAGYWKALGLMAGTAADALAGKYGKTRAEALEDMAAWAEVESSRMGKEA